MILTKNTWQTYSFDSKKIEQHLDELIKILTDMEVDFTDREQLKEGFEKLFHIEYHNLPDFTTQKYILASNHVSDFDALILGLLHTSIRIVSKNDWVNNAELSKFLSLHYDLVGIDRDSKINQARVLVGLIKYLAASSESRHVLIFPQGTISDINRNSIERVQQGVFSLSAKSKTPILPIFVEQASFEFPTRIIFGEPMAIPERDQDCRAIWKDQVIALQNSLTPPARKPVLTEKHANNNKPGDPFF